MCALAAQWILSQTATDTIGISRGILQAATRNNVQPTALAAAQAFGTTLPMSHSSLSTVDRLCTKTQENQVLHPLKLKVGYLKEDSG